MMFWHWVRKEKPSSWYPYAVYVADVLRGQALFSQSDLAVDLRFAWVGHLFQCNGTWMWRQCLPEAVLKVTNLGSTRAKASLHLLDYAAQPCQGYCTMPQLQCLNWKAEGCMLESSDHSAHPQALTQAQGTTQAPSCYAISSPQPAALPLQLPPPFCWFSFKSSSSRKGEKVKDFKPPFLLNLSVGISSI